MKKQRKLIKKLYIVIIILVLVLALLWAIDYNLLDSAKKLFEEPELIVLEDDCGIIVGNLIHEIKSEENCRIMCYNTCGVLDKDFVKSEFIGRDDSCNECNCYCK